MSICTAEATKALESQTGVPIDWNTISTSPAKDWIPDTSCFPYALSPNPELNEDLPEHLDDLPIFFGGRHFGG